MVQSGNGNGHDKDYTPEVEFEYLDADVWIETDTEGNQNVVYTEDIIEILKEEDDEQSDSNDN